MQNFGTYRVSEHRLCDSVQITFFGSDADAARKGWRSIGVTSVPVAELTKNIEAIERGGRRAETRDVLPVFGGR